MTETEARPTFSIITTVSDSTVGPTAPLTAMLTQQYDGYEVIVVNESTSEEYTDTLKRLRAEHRHLYTTFLPHYHFQKNRRRLAFSLGARAAKKQWLVFTDVTDAGPSDQWLTQLADACDEQTAVLLGYTNRKTGDVRLKSYTTLSEAAPTISKTERRRVDAAHKNWLSFLLRNKAYDFIVTRAEEANEMLRLFATEPKTVVPKE